MLAIQEGFQTVDLVIQPRFQTRHVLPQPAIRGKDHPAS